MQFLVDAQLPPALARLIAESGPVAEHITDIGSGEAADRDLWRYALSHQAVIVTNNAQASADRYIRRGLLTSVVG